MATPEENKAAALKKANEYNQMAAMAAARGDTDKMEMYSQRAATWNASASRYDRIIDAKERIATAKSNIEKISSEPKKAPSGNGFRSLVMGSTTPIQQTAVPQTPTVSPTPPTPAITPVSVTPPVQPVKTAPIDTILFNEDDVPIQIMQDLIFENIGGQELINIARNDTINGQNIIYQPIKNLTSIQQAYNPNNIVALQATLNKYFQNFPIKFENKVPENPTGPNGAHVYIDPETGDLVIEAVNLDPDEQIEVEITTSGTIYEADI